jgi:serine/threonine-protein kinase
MKGTAGTVLGPAPGLVLAMDQFQLGQKVEARKTLEKTLKTFDRRLEIADHREAWMAHILRREAEQLIISRASEKP